MVVALSSGPGVDVLLNYDCGEFCYLIIGEDTSDSDNSREDDAEVEVVACETSSAARRGNDAGPAR